ncbi:MAG: type II secretion system F family protein [Frankiales bacterium]|nr:type II secretion system F family protein [Frankiales bacterium]
MIVVVGALLVGVGIVIAVVGREYANNRRVRDLRAVLEMQSLTPARAEDADRTSSLLARSGLVAERALGQASVLHRLAHALDRSDWTLSPGEFAVVSAVTAALCGVVGLVLMGAVGLFVFGAIGLATPYLLVLRSVNKRRDAFEEQFPDVLDLVAASLESGASVAHALQLVVDEADEPAAAEFGRVLTATRMGATLPEAMLEAADRIGSRDLDWTVTAITVQQRTGGKLAEILRIVARTMRERSEVKRELVALTAEGRLSAYILGGLPFGLAGFLLVANPHYLRPLYTDPLGITLLVIAGFLMLCGFAWMRRIVRVEV